MPTSLAFDTLFKIFLPSDNSDEWLWYIQGAMKIVHEVGLGHTQPSGVSGLLDWVYYHDALSRFTTYHWRRRDTTLKPLDEASPGIRDIRNPLHLKSGPVCRHIYLIISPQLMTYRHLFSLILFMKS